VTVKEVIKQILIGNPTVKPTPAVKPILIVQPTVKPTPITKPTDTWTSTVISS
jgi:hypothetical protein